MIPRVVKPFSGSDREPKLIDLEKGVFLGPAHKESHRDSELSLQKKNANHYLLVLLQVRKRILVFLLVVFTIVGGVRLWNLQGPETNILGFSRSSKKC